MVNSSVRREIDAKGRTVRELLANRKYSIDYYQREYKWQGKQLLELLNDLEAKFSDSYENEHERSAVADYGHYFLGSVIISDKSSSKFIIDGQQRLTTLTLLLIFLQHKLGEDDDQKAQLAELIFSQKYGKRSFNLDIPERTPCMEALYTAQLIDPVGQPESVVNILARFRDIAEIFPKKLLDGRLPFFVDWLIENVHFVEITAYSDNDAYTIFEAMNDRGLSLSPVDMLKGYVLANISDEDLRGDATKTWKGRVDKLREFGKDEDADGIKSWLRSQHAETIRERKIGSLPQDFDLIGTEFHRWVRDQEVRLGLKSSNDFYKFVQQDFSFYTSWYLRLREAAERFDAALPAVYYNAQHNFTLQYPLLLSPLRLDDSEEVIYAKVEAVSTFIDVLINRRIWNFRSIDYSTMQYAMFLTMRETRRVSLAELPPLLKDRLSIVAADTFAANDRFALHGTNRRQIHNILARITDFIETRSGQASHFVEYMQRDGKKGYEIEHIWSNHPERHIADFPDQSDFREYRNRIGDLVLLPKSFNASYGALEYSLKRPHYNGQNLLARSLVEAAYDRNPGFKKFLDETTLAFRPHTQFRKSDVDERQALYTHVAETIWNAERIGSAS